MFSTFNTRKAKSPTSHFFSTLATRSAVRGNAVSRGNCACKPRHALSSMNRFLSPSLLQRRQNTDGSKECEVFTSSNADKSSATVAPEAYQHFFGDTSRRSEYAYPDEIQNIYNKSSLFSNTVSDFHPGAVDVATKLCNSSNDPRREYGKNYSIPVETTASQAALSTPNKGGVTQQNIEGTGHSAGAKIHLPGPARLFNTLCTVSQDTGDETFVFWVGGQRFELPSHVISSNLYRDSFLGEITRKPVALKQGESIAIHNNYATSVIRPPSKLNSMYSTSTVEACRSHAGNYRRIGGKLKEIVKEFHIDRSVDAFKLLIEFLIQATAVSNSNLIKPYVVGTSLRQKLLVNELRHWGFSEPCIQAIIVQSCQKTTVRKKDSLHSLNNTLITASGCRNFNCSFAQRENELCPSNVPEKARHVTFVETDQLNTLNEAGLSSASSTSSKVTSLRSELAAEQHAAQTNCSALPKAGDCHVTARVSSSNPNLGVVNTQGVNALVGVDYVDADAVISLWTKRRWLQISEHSNNLMSRTFNSTELPLRKLHQPAWYALAHEDTETVATTLYPMLEGPLLAEYLCTRRLRQWPFGSIPAAILPYVSSLSSANSTSHQCMGQCLSSCVLSAKMFSSRQDLIVAYTFGDISLVIEDETTVLVKLPQCELVGAFDFPEPIKLPETNLGYPFVIKYIDAKTCNGLEETMKKENCHSSAALQLAQDSSQLYEIFFSQSFSILCRLSLKKNYLKMRFLDHNDSSFYTFHPLCNAITRGRSLSQLEYLVPCREEATKFFLQEKAKISQNESLESDALSISSHLPSLFQIRIPCLPYPHSIQYYEFGALIVSNRVGTPAKESLGCDNFNSFSKDDSHDNSIVAVLLVDPSYCCFLGLNPFKCDSSNAKMNQNSFQVCEAAEHCGMKPNSGSGTISTCKLCNDFCDGGAQAQKQEHMQYHAVPSPTLSCNSSASTAPCTHCEQLSHHQSAPTLTGQHMCIIRATGLNQELRLGEDYGITACLAGNTISIFFLIKGYLLQESVFSPLQPTKALNPSWLCATSEAVFEMGQKAAGVIVPKPSVFAKGGPKTLILLEYLTSSQMLAEYRINEGRYFQHTIGKNRFENLLNNLVEYLSE